MDIACVLGSVRKTGRLVIAQGPSSEAGLAAMSRRGGGAGIREPASSNRSCGGQNTAIPFNLALERASVPQVGDSVAGVRSASCGDLGLGESWSYLMFWLAVGVLFVVVAMAVLDLVLAASPWPRRTAIGLAVLPGAALTGLAFLESGLGPVAVTLLLTGVGFGSTALLPPARSAMSGPDQVGSTRSLPQR